MPSPTVEKLLHPVKRVPLETPAYVEENLHPRGSFPAIRANFALHPSVSFADRYALRGRVEAFLKTVSEKMEAELRDQGVIPAQCWSVGIRQTDTRNETHPTAGPYKTFGIDASAGFIFRGAGQNTEKSRYDAATQQIALSILKRHFRTARTGVEGIVKRLNAQYAKVPA